MVDSSVVVKWFVRELGHGQALALLDHQDELFAPDVIVPEVIDCGLGSGLLRVKLATIREAPL